MKDLTVPTLITFIIILALAIISMRQPAKSYDDGSEDFYYDYIAQ